jgi:hypothetical protein
MEQKDFQFLGIVVHKEFECGSGLPLVEVNKKLESVGDSSPMDSVIEVAEKLERMGMVVSKMTARIGRYVELNVPGLGRCLREFRERRVSHKEKGLGL